jgi:hypothetical protein
MSRSTLGRNQADPRAFAASFGISAVVHAVVLGVGLAIAPIATQRVIPTTEPQAQSSPEEVITLVWPVMAPRATSASEPVVAPPQISAQSDHDPGAGEPAGGATDPSVAAGVVTSETALPDDVPASEGFGTLATELPSLTRRPESAPGLLEAGKPIDLPTIRTTASEGTPAADGTAQEDDEDEEEEKSEGGGLGSILDGLGSFLGGIKVSVGGMGGGAGGSGAGGPGKGGCVPGIGGLIGERGGKGGVVIPQGPGIRTGIGGRGAPRMPYQNAPMRLDPCHPDR